jgi:hypothetical protein
MTKKLAIMLVVVMLAIVAWSLLFDSNVVTIVVNGQQVSGPMKDAVGIGGLVVAVVAFFCAAILLLFVFAWIGIVVLGLLIGAATIAATLAFPFLLPLLIPLAILAADARINTQRGQQISSPAWPSSCGLHRR